MAEKPIVHYRWGDVYPTIVEGKPVVGIKPVDHKNHVPGQAVSNRNPVITSPVIRIGAVGEFETLNTIYRPCEPFYDDE